MAPDPPGARPDAGSHDPATSTTVEEVVEIVERERSLSRRALLGAAARVAIASAAYEVAALGLAGCAGRDAPFRSRSGPLLLPRSFRSLQGRSWAGLTLGETTVADLARLRFDGEVELRPEPGRVELVPRRRPRGAPHRVVLVMRDPGSRRPSLARDATLARIELGYRVRGRAAHRLREAVVDRFGRGETVHYGTEGAVVRTYLLYRRHHVLAEVDDAEGGPLWVVFYAPGLLRPVADDLRLCSAGCTYCTESCTSCTTSCTECTGSCVSGCTGACTACTACTTGCTAACTAGCTVECTRCTGMCTRGCTHCTSCTYRTACLSATICGACTGCTHCTEACTVGCTATCTACTAACTRGCTASCTTGCTACTACTFCTEGCTASCTACTASCTTCTEGCTGRTGGIAG